MIIALSIIGCGGKKNPNPEPDHDKLENKTQQTDILSIFNDTVKTVQTEHFYKMEKSLEDIQKEVELLRTQVMKYEQKFPEVNYTKQLKELIDKQPAAHKIFLKNGSIIEGRTVFCIAGILIGICSGPNQAASRSLMGRMTPKDKENEFYGFFAFSGNATEFIGPFLFSTIVSMTGSLRCGVGMIAVLFFIGFILLNAVNYKENIDTQ